MTHNYKLTNDHQPVLQNNQKRKNRDLTLLRSSGFCSRFHRKV